MSNGQEFINNYNQGTDYAQGFVTDVETIDVPKGLSEETVKFISKQKKEPKWMLEWRLKAFQRLQSMKEPDWQKPKYPKIDYQDLYYYSAPKSLQDQPKSLDEIDPEIRKTYDKLGIPLLEQKRLSGIAVDAVFDSIEEAMKDGTQVSVAGFGIFEAKMRAAREARNPRTGETVQVAATTVPKFKASKTLKDTVAGK